MKTSLITKGRKLPNFIKSHDIFKKFKEIEKVFPEFGLKNCSTSVKQLRYLQLAAEGIKKNLIKSFTQPYIYYFDDEARAKRIVALLKTCEASEFISNNKLIVPKKLKKEVPTSFNTTYIECKYAKDEQRYYKGVSYYNIYHPLSLSATSKIVFSSDGIQGMWDMATMSMRGISSCQSWDGSYKRNLVGSIVDPCAGIIYLTDGIKVNKGERMQRRAVVRYVISKKGRNPALLIERIYPSTSKDNDQVVALFAAFLKKHTKNKLPIVTSPHGYYIPNSKIVSKLSSCGSFDDAKGHCKSYRDSGIPYSKSSFSLYLKKITT